jgi:hypothetical protein
VAETKRTKNGNGVAKSHTGKRPHELMLEWVQIGAMEVPEPVKKDYFVKKLFPLSESSHISLLTACMPYYHAKMTHRRGAVEGKPLLRSVDD